MQSYYEIQLDFSVIVVNFLKDIPYHNAPGFFKRHDDGDDVRLRYDARTTAALLISMFSLTP